MPHQPEVVFKSRIVDYGIRIDNLLVIAKGTKGRTLIHGTAFMEDLYEIRAERVASNRLNLIIDSIVGKLGVSKGDAFTDDHLKTVATEFVAQHTRTRFTVAQVKMRGLFQVLGQMEKPYRNVIIVTIIAWGLTDVLFELLHINGIQFDISVAIEVNAGFFIALVLSVILPAFSRGGSRHE